MQFLHLCPYGAIERQQVLMEPVAVCTKPLIEFLFFSFCFALFFSL